MGAPRAPLYFGRYIRYLLLREAGIAEYQLEQPADHATASAQSLTQFVVGRDGMAMLVLVGEVDISTASGLGRRFGQWHDSGDCIGGQSDHGEAAAVALQQALYLARVEVHADGGAVGKALAVGRAGAVLNHWLGSLARLKCHAAENGPLTLGELFQRVQLMSHDPRQQIALEDQTQRRARETSAHSLIESASQLIDQALGLLWMHGSLNGQSESELRTMAERLLTQASGVVLCAANLFSDTLFGGPEETSEDEPEESEEAEKSEVDVTDAQADSPVIDDVAGESGSEPAASDSVGTPETGDTSSESESAPVVCSSETYSPLAEWPPTPQSRGPPDRRRVRGH